MNDQELITAVRQSVHGARMNVPPEQIVSRSRTIRASGHRRLAVCGTAAAAVGSVVLALGLEGGTGATAHSTGTIRTAAFTLSANANGTDTLTIQPRVLFEPATLQRDLAQYGIPAKVTIGEYCSTDPAPAGSDQAVTFTPITHGHNGHITIDPAAMPAGTELSIGIFRLSPPVPVTGLEGRPGVADQEVEFGLIDTNSYTCTSTPNSLPPGPYGSGR
jgi:hypothetical protein